MKQVTLIMMVFLCHYFTAQITVQNTQSPAQIVQNVLLGSGVSAFNIKYNGVTVSNPKHNVTKFNATGTNFPIGQGVLLTTGNYHTAIGPNDDDGTINDANDTYPILNDADLDSIASDIVTDGVILEFDFNSTSDTMSFAYMFASEEYNEYVGNLFNDVFGFFLSGPGISGNYLNNGINLAKLPTTSTSSTTVSINNVNGGNNWVLPVVPSSNSNYYIDNESSQAFGNAIQYDGTTTLLHAGAKLICGNTYHIKLCLANVGDEQFGSAVFIKAKSFSAPDNSFKIVSNFTDSTEECPNNASISIIRGAAQDTAARTINVTYTGTATAGSDYQVLPSSFTFPIGVDTLVIPINLINDHIIEGSESIIITSSFTNTCGLIMVADTIIVNDPVPLNISVLDYIYYCPKFNSHVEVTSGAAPYTYLWFDNSTNDSISLNNLTPNQPSNFIVSVTDACGQIVTDTSIVTYLPIKSNFTANPLSSATPSTVSFTNLSQNATQFDWDFNNGNTILDTNLSNQSSLYSDTGNYTIQLIAYNGNCSDTSYKTIIIIDYPKVITSNVFTPNGDGVNDLYYFNTFFVKSLSVTILDRWGAVVYEEESAKPKWNGKDLKGNELSDGVYFYLFTATGYIGDPVTGSGFLHLVKN